MPRSEAAERAAQWLKDLTARLESSPLVTKDETGMLILSLASVSNIIYLALQAGMPLSSEMEAIRDHLKKHLGGVVQFRIGMLQPPPEKKK